MGIVDGDNLPEHIEPRLWRRTQRPAREMLEGSAMRIDGRAEPFPEALMSGDVEQWARFNRWRKGYVLYEVIIDGPTLIEWLSGRYPAPIVTPPIKGAGGRTNDFIDRTWHEVVVLLAKDECRVPPNGGTAAFIRQLIDRTRDGGWSQNINHKSWEPRLEPAFKEARRVVAGTALEKVLLPESGKRGSSIRDRVWQLVVVMVAKNRAIPTEEQEPEFIKQLQQAAGDRGWPTDQQQWEALLTPCFAAGRAVKPRRAKA
jgi:hypothetical protein